MTRKWYSVLVLAMVLGLGACGSVNADGPRTRSDVITAQELSQLRVNDLYEAIDRLRPRWLEVRAQRSFTANTMIVVYQGQSYLGGTNVLREIGLGGIEEIRYLDGPTASATLPGIGMRQVEGAIVINPT